MDIDPNKVTITQPSEDIDPNKITITEPEFDPNQVTVSGSEIDPDQVTVNTPESKYETPGQQLLTGAEGAAQGVLGPVATGIGLGAHKLGLDEAVGIDTSAEAMRGRREANPAIHGVSQATAMAGSMALGVGEAGLLAKGAAKLLPEATTVLSKLGSAAVSGAIQMGAIQAGDEISKAMLGQGDPEAPVSSALGHIGGAALLGAGTGVFFNAGGQAGSKGLAALENSKMGTKAQNILIGMGAAAKARAAGVPEKEAAEFVTNYLRSAGVEDLNYSLYKTGVKAYYGGVGKLVNKVTSKVAATGIGGGVGAAVGSVFGPYAGNAAAGTASGVSLKYLAPVIEKILDKPIIGMSNKVVVPVIMHALAKGETTGLFNYINYATQAAKGAKTISNGIEGLLRSGSSQMISMPSEKDKQKIMSYIDEGGIGAEMEKSQSETPQFAEGGEVQPQNSGSLSGLYPEQDVMMNTAKARVSNYLTSLKPNANPARLPFDMEPDMTDAKKTYTNAVTIAAAPLAILNHIKDGSIQIEQVKHFTSLYPELHKHLSQKLTEGIINANMKGERPPYKTRMAMSLFMGTALDSSMTPASIQAAQTTYTPKQQPVPMQGGKKDSPSKLGKSDKNYKTASQAAEGDRNDRD